MAKNIIKKAAKELAERVKAGDGLAMDYASRMQRAREQGFDEQVFYHGTRAPGQVDDLKSGFKDSDVGTFFAADEDAARFYSGDEFDPLEFRLKMKNPFNPSMEEHVNAPWVDDWINSWRKKGGWIGEDGEALTNDDVKKIIRESDLWFYDLGTGERWHDFLQETSKHHDSFRGFVPADGGETAVIFDPSNIRSPNAAFDPAKSKSRDILAGIGGAGVVGAAASTAPQKSYAQELVEARPQSRIEGAQSPWLSGIADWLGSIRTPGFAVTDYPYESTAEMLRDWSYGDRTNKLNLLFAPMEVADPSNLPALIGGTAKYFMDE